MLNSEQQAAAMLDGALMAAIRLRGRSALAAHLEFLAQRLRLAAESFGEGIADDIQPNGSEH